MDPRDPLGKILLAVVVSLLVACGTPTPSPTPLWFSPTPRPTPTPTPTPAPYGNFFPIPPGLQPEDGWKTHRLEVLNSVIQYPAAYDENCGAIFITQKPNYLLVGFERVAITIHLFKSWNGDLAAHVAEVRSSTASSTQWLTEPEPFLLDGEPAFRYMFDHPVPSVQAFGKQAFASFDGKLYGFTYLYVPEFNCDHPPFPDEAVYEHMLSTWEFIR
jgi:hypothetical protein